MTELSWTRSTWKEAGPDERKRVDQAHECESLRILKLCIVSEKYTKENWMESMASQWSSSGESTQDTHHCKSFTPETHGFLEMH